MSNTNNKSHAPGTWYLAPAGDLTNEHAAGYDGNTFETWQEARDAIPGLQDLGGDFRRTVWIAVQRPRPVIVDHQNGHEEAFESFDAAIASLRARYPDLAYGHDGDLSCGGESTSVWADADDREDEDGYSACPRASIRWDVQSADDDEQCECGSATGVACEWSGPPSEMVTIEWMPVHLRSSHEAAGGRGRYPANGALRLEVSPDCAANLIEHDGDWTKEVQP